MQLNKSTKSLAPKQKSGNGKILALVLRLPSTTRPLCAMKNGPCDILHLATMSQLTLLMHIFHGGMFGPSVSPYSDTDHAFWLLSSASSWLPKKIHSFLLEGMKSWQVWLWGDWGMDKGGDWKSNGTLSRALHEGAEGKAFKWTRPIKDDVLHRAQLAINTLKLSDPPEHITELFIAHDFPQEWIKDAMKRRKA